MFRYLCLGLAAVAVALASACDRGGAAGAPGLVPHDEFPGLSDAVEIRIDQLGIPHIYGNNNDDVAYASGYQMATDRLFQMDLVRRRALGREAEVLGEEYVDRDVLARVFDLRRWGQANGERLRAEAPDIYNLVVSWLAGVNKRIEEVRAGTVPLPYGFGRNELDYEPETWALADHFAIAKLISLANSNSLEREIIATVLERLFSQVWNRFELSRPMFEVAIMADEEIPAGLSPNARSSSRRSWSQPSGSRPSSFRPSGSRPSGSRLAAPQPGVAGSVPEGIIASLDRLRRATGHLPGLGSNNWAVDGRHTADGRPLIAGDPHQPLQSPSVMYAQHLNSLDGQGDLDVIGFSFVGTAGVQLGHNRHVHWTATTNFADVMDIWEVRVGPDGVYIGDELLPWDERKEVIEVANGSAVTLQIRDIPGYGVILPAELLPPLPIVEGGRELLLNWTGFAATSEEQCFLRMSTATDLDAYEAAVDLMEVGGFNFVAADKDGISYRVQIDVPDRDLANGALPYLVMDGDDASSFWNGFLPADKLPRTRARDRGWLASANNDPWGFTFNGDVTDDPFYYGYFYAAGHRAQRIHDRLAALVARGAVTVEDMQALQLDTHSAISDQLLPLIAKAAAAIDSDPDLAEFAGREDIAALARLLAEWDQRMDSDSAGALAWHVWLHLFAEEAVADDFTILFETIFAEEAPYAIKIPALAALGRYAGGTESLIKGGVDRAVVRALAATADWLTAEFGAVEPASYTWGDRHVTRFANPFGGDLDGGSLPTSGGEDTVNVSSSEFYQDSAPAQRFESKSGPVFRIVTRFADDGIPESVANFPRGNSGNPNSPHWDDTVGDWAAGNYVPLPFRRAEVEAATAETVILEP